MKGILGRKVGMTQLLTERGVVVPVTVIEAGPCYVTQIKMAEKDGYTAVQLGYQETRPKRLTKGEIGHLRRRNANMPVLRIFREFRLKDTAEFAVGQKVSADIFIVGELVDVRGTSKGRGFQGGVKRYNFRGGPRTHGQSDRLRAPGASSSGTTPGRIYKGKHMAGHMGNAPVTVSNLRVELVDPERNLLAVRGAVPGAKGGLVVVTTARKQPLAVIRARGEVTMQASVMNMAGEKVGQVELAETIFSAPINGPLMHQAMVRQLANARLGTHKVKGRSEVAGGGRKPWKQKGTGRARQGSIRSAQWRGGGIIFGPTPRSYAQRMPRKMRRAALCSALSAKAAEERIVILDALRVTEPKTREMAEALKALVADSRALILTAEANEMVERSAKNLGDVKLLRAHYLNIRDLMTYDFVIIPQDALAVLVDILGLSKEIERMHVYDVIRRPIVTEKTTEQAEENKQYSFEVDRRANKMQVKDAVETAFSVKVLEVNIINIPPKKGRYGRLMVTKKPAFKKAVVKLAPGSSIQFFEGV